MGHSLTCGGPASRSGFLWVRVMASQGQGGLGRVRSGGFLIFWRLCAWLCGRLLVSLLRRCWAVPVMGGRGVMGKYITELVRFFGGIWGFA